MEQRKNESETMNREDFTPAEAGATNNLFEELFILDTERRNAEVAYAKNPLDVPNLVKWGIVLIHLSKFQNNPDSFHMRQDGFSKFEEALTISPREAKTSSMIGQVYLEFGLETQDFAEAKTCIDKATECLQDAVNQLELDNPDNLKLHQLLETCAKVRLYILQQQIEHANSDSEQTLDQGSSASLSKAKDSKRNNKKTKKSSDLKYDICGWVILAVGVFALVAMRPQPQVPPPPYM